MTAFSNAVSIKNGTDILKNIRVAVCGNLKTACNALRQEGICQIDEFADAIDLVFKLRGGEKYHMVLVYAPQGEGLTTNMPYKVECQGEWKNVPVKLLNEPACNSALIELKYAIRSIVKKQLET